MGHVETKTIGESKQLLADEVFHHIGRLIVEGELGEGERIRDVDVADELHVSRTPVREALQRLERLGLVTMYPSRYTEVTAVTAAVVTQSLEFAGYQAGIAARMAVPRLSPAERQRVVRLMEEVRRTLRDGASTSSARWAVFAYLAEHSGNHQHRMLITDVDVALARNLRAWVVPRGDRERMRQVYDDFEIAVARGNGDEAERLARAMYYV
ncbi:GntR family transcriptional regulator [Microbacterium sufflavum]|uniref:GntR family transcriptional regulator n=1 Tax=Microbacterium sufflavum TaxID=2851649 RepID=A0ABY4IBZ5_9MICO|nr:GntR family transcriptional regulator [Microbacterium sufflavum]UPL09820.1 GntR family transcriptional regulator [Microbacterium sufflavum]